VPDGVDHRHHREPERGRDPDRAERLRPLIVDDDCAAAREHERESRERFGEAAPRERAISQEARR